MIQRGAEEEGYHTLDMLLFYEEFNDMTLKGKDSPKNIAALYRSYGLESPQ